MDLKDKVITALRQTLEPEYVRLEDDDGVSGFVVSSLFKGISALDRQGRIEEILRDAPLTPEERRRILMIAALTPNEYAAVGARIRVHRIRETAEGEVEIMLHGGLTDAEYVRGTLDNQKGIQTFDPEQVSGAIGILIKLRAKGTEASPLTKTKAMRILQKDEYIEVMSNA